MTNPIAPSVVVRLRPKVAFKYFALLDHWWGDEASPAAARKLEPTLTDPGFWTATGVKEHKALQDCIKDFFDKTVTPRIAALKIELSAAGLSAEDKETLQWEWTSWMRAKYLRFAVANLKDPA